MRFKKWLIFVTLLATACSAAVAVESDEGEEKPLSSPTAVIAEPTEAVEEPTKTVEEPTAAAEEPTAPVEEPTGVEEPTATPTTEATQGESEFLAPETPPVGAERQFSTEFDKHTVPYDKILSGGPPKDGIPSIDDPKFETVEEADAWLQHFESDQQTRGLFTLEEL